MINKLIQYLILALVTVNIALTAIQMRIQTTNKVAQDSAWKSCYEYRMPYMQIVGGEVYCGVVYQGQSYYIPLKDLPK